MRILQNETAAVVIDIQEKLLPHIHGKEKILQNCLKLIEGLQILSVPIIVTQQYTHGLGASVPSVAQKFSDFSYIEKVSFSCFEAPGFEEQIKFYGKTNIIICGIEAHVCVLQTSLDMLAAGLNPVIIEDCVSSRRPNDKHIAIERMRQEGVCISTLESILFEMTRNAGNETFKKISRVIK